MAQALETEPLEKIFQHKVLGMLWRKGKITEEVAKLIMSWRHSGFNVHCGPRIQPGGEEATENLARYTCPPLEDRPSIILAGEPALARHVCLLQAWTMHY